MLEVRDLSSLYGGAHILQGVDISIPPEKTVVVLGRNGAGKTTLVRSIIGLSPPTVGSGAITWQGTSLTGLPSNKIARLGIGLVPQGRHVFGSLTVSENLRVAARRPAGMSDPWTESKVFEFFPRLGERRAQRASNLSGGEQQMLAIGRALMTNPALLIMDEPSEGLAPKVLDIIGEQLVLLKQGGMSILLVEQNLRLALRLADWVYVLGPPGHVVWSGTPAELQQDPTAQAQHLGVA